MNPGDIYNLGETKILQSGKANKTWVSKSAASFRRIFKNRFHTKTCYPNRFLVDISLCIRPQYFKRVNESDEKGIYGQSGKSDKSDLPVLLAVPIQFEILFVLDTVFPAHPCASQVPKTSSHWKSAAPEVWWACPLTRLPKSSPWILRRWWRSWNERRGPPPRTELTGETRWGFRLRWGWDMRMKTYSARDRSATVTLALHSCKSSTCFKGV